MGTSTRCQQKARTAASTIELGPCVQKLDIFAKEYLLVPVHEHLHWSLLLICFPGTIAEKGEEAGRAPLMLHLDSLSGAAPDQPMVACIYKHLH